MKDIGSIFPIYDHELNLHFSGSRCLCLDKEQIHYSLCREALYAIAKKHSNSNKRVLLPAYTCQTVIDPFRVQGWTCNYYNIKKDLRIDIKNLVQSFDKNIPTITLVHPYLGMDLNDVEIEALTYLKEKGCTLVEDLTQTIFSTARNEIFDYYVGSFRKWVNVPDGGFLEGRNLDGIELPEMDYSEFVSKQTDAMYLRGQYFQNGNEHVKSISIRLYKDAVKSLNCHGPLHKMSDLSRQIWVNTNIESIIKRRLSNFLYLHRGIKQSNKIKFITDDISNLVSAPLYFPIYVKDRSSLQKRLADSHIYAPILWPVQSSEVLINDNIKYIYDSILMLPIDQRYDEHDMNQIIQIVNSYE